MSAVRAPTPLQAVATPSRRAGVLSRHVRVLILAAAGAAALAGCAVGPNYHTPKLATPADYAAGSSTRAPQDAPAKPTPPIELATWWHALGDPELDSLIDRAVKDNPDVLIALDRLQAARTFEVGTLSNLLPAAEASAGGGKGTGSDLGRGRASQQLVSAETGTGLKQVNVLAGFDAAWELDIFGKYRRELEAARYDAQAAAAARNAVLVAVISNVARAYVDLRGFQTRSAVLHAAIDVLQKSLDIVSERYRRGITNELDVTLATRELNTLKAQVAPLDSEVDAAEYTIATLLGQYPEDLVKELAPTAMVPSVPATVQAGAPLDLLRRRPDIQQAERQLAASTARIGVAVGSLFPQIAVTGAIGYEHQGLGTTPSASQHIWAAGPSVFWPVLDFGALDAQVQVANLQTRAQLVNYKRVIQSAVQEVDTAVSAYSAQQVSLESLGQAVAAGQRAVSLANQRYDRGLTDFLNVVDAERQEYAIEDEYTQTRVAACEQFIALYRGLGGGWENYQRLPPIRKPLPAVVAAFRSLVSRDDSPLSDGPLGDGPMGDGPSSSATSAPPAAPAPVTSLQTNTAGR
jgi:NodT family efflux transporter outer membrane factor (OMF) lipoprotein